MFKTSVGATADRIPGETNDCGVIGLANATGLPYADIHSRLKSKGRRFRRGTKVHMVEAVLADLKREGIVSEYKSVYNCGISSNLAFALNGRSTVASLLRRLPHTGRFFLCSTSHAFALTNGTLYNNMENTQMRARMRVALEVTMASQVAPQPAVAAPKANVWTPLPASERPRFSAEGYHARVIAARMEY